MYDMPLQIVDDSSDDVVFTSDWKPVPMKYNSKKFKAEGDPAIEEIIECNIQLACSNTKRESVSTASYTTVKSESVVEDMKSGSSVVSGLETYSVPIQGYNMPSATFTPQTSTYIINTDPSGQQDISQQTLTSMWQDVQQNPYLTTEFTPKQQVCKSY